MQRQDEYGNPIKESNPYLNFLNKRVFVSLRDGTFVLGTVYNVSNNAISGLARIFVKDDKDQSFMLHEDRINYIRPDLKSNGHKQSGDQNE